MRPRHRVYGELHIHAPFRQQVVQFADLVLRLRNRHAITRNNHHRTRIAQDPRRFFRSCRAHRARFLRSGARLQLPESAEEHVGERSVHRPAHYDRQNETGRPVKRTGDNQQLVVQRKTHRACG